jgi:hypothetical protein
MYINKKINKNKSDNNMYINKKINKNKSDNNMYINKKINKNKSDNTTVNTSRVLYNNGIKGITEENIIEKGELEGRRYKGKETIRKKRDSKIIIKNYKTHLSNINNNKYSRPKTPRNKNSFQINNFKISNQSDNKSSIINMQSAGNNNLNNNNIIKKYSKSENNNTKNIIYDNKQGESDIITTITNKITDIKKSLEKLKKSKKSKYLNAGVLNNKISKVEKFSYINDDLPQIQINDISDNNIIDNISDNNDIIDDISYNNNIIDNINNNTTDNKNKEILNNSKNKDNIYNNMNKSNNINNIRSYNNLEEKLNNNNDIYNNINNNSRSQNGIQQLIKNTNISNDNQSNNIQYANNNMQSTRNNNMQSANYDMQSTRNNNNNNMQSANYNMQSTTNNNYNNDNNNMQSANYNMQSTTNNNYNNDMQTTTNNIEYDEDELRQQVIIGYRDLINKYNDKNIIIPNNIENMDINKAIRMYEREKEFVEKKGGLSTLKIIMLIIFGSLEYILNRIFQIDMSGYLSNQINYMNFYDSALYDIERTNTIINTNNYGPFTKLIIFASITTIIFVITKKISSNNDNKDISKNIKNVVFDNHKLDNNDNDNDNDNTNSNSNNNSGLGNILNNIGGIGGIGNLLNMASSFLGGNNNNNNNNNVEDLHMKKPKRRKRTKKQGN